MAYAEAEECYTSCLICTVVDNPIHCITRSTMAACVLDNGISTCFAYISLCIQYVMLSEWALAGTNPEGARSF